MDYSVSSDYSVAQRVISSLESLGVELNVQQDGQSVTVLSRYGGTGTGEYPFGIAMGDDATDIILIMRGIDAIVSLAEQDSDTAFALMNEINLYLGESFAYSGTLFVEDGVPQIRYFISCNDHELQDRMSECVSQAALFANEVVLIANGSRPLSSLGAQDKDCFSMGSDKVSAKAETPAVVPARKKGLFGRLFS